MIPSGEGKMERIKGSRLGTAIYLNVVELVLCILLIKIIGKSGFDT